MRRSRFRSNLHGHLGGNLRSQTGGFLGTEACDEQLFLDLEGEFALILEFLDAVGAEIGFREGGTDCGDDLLAGLREL